MMLTTSVIAELCVYILTWNVGTHHPDDSVPLTDALSLNGTSNCPLQQLPDIYLVAMQEVNAEVQRQILGLFQDNPWAFKVRENLDSFEYVKVDTVQLQGLLLMLFSQRQHIPHMKNIETQSTRTGLGGLWGNKGAVSIRMSLYGMGVTFVNAHLAAHDEELKERIEDYNQIVSNHHYEAHNYLTIFDHDFVFWFGDLNFRLNTKESAFDVRHMIEQGKLDELLQQDQLKLVRQSGNAFSMLQEQLPTFPPTFKFIENTSDYDLKQQPSWCDRILYRVQVDKYPDIRLNITQLSYRSHPSYMLSDHKPVSAEFLYKIEAESQTDEDLHEMTHSGAGSSEHTPYASVIIMLIVALAAGQQY